MEGPSTETQSDAEPLSYSVVESVARHKGMDPLSLAPPLYEVLDPDALDVLFTGEGGTGCPGEISFEYSGCRVTVSSDGHVSVEGVEGDSATGRTTS